MSQTIELNVNDGAQRVDLDPHQPLLGVLREMLGLTGSKIGCGEGVCGACTVLVDGAPIRSCITPMGDVAGKAILTIEGLARDGQLHPVQQAFLDQEAFQCAYCTPGMIMNAVGLLHANAHPTEEEIIRSMDGNVCRCGTYPRILRAIQQAAQANSGETGVGR
jgi:nicotinate dehydrogenase subunit A